jgi:hypothetical protein
MVRALILGLAGSLSLLIASARADLDLTPKLSHYELDGVKFQQLAFSDGSKIVTYAPPRGWDYSGSATQLTLRPPGKSQAEATIKKIALSQPASFDEETVKKLVQEAIASVPPGSTDIQLVSQEKNPLMIERKETFLVTLSYNLYGAAYNRSILFLNRGVEQIQFQLSCRRADFTALQAAFLDSQHSWQNL